MTKGKGSRADEKGKLSGMTRWGDIEKMTNKKAPLRRGFKHIFLVDFFDFHVKV